MQMRIVIFKARDMYPQLVGRVEGCNATKPLYWRVCADRPRLKHHHRDVWNEMKRKEWYEIWAMVEWNLWQEKMKKKRTLPRLRFVQHETHVNWPRRELGTPEVGGERLTSCATKAPAEAIYLLINGRCT